MRCVNRCLIQFLQRIFSSQLTWRLQYCATLPVINHLNWILPTQVRRFAVVTAVLVLFAIFTPFLSSFSVWFYIFLELLVPATRCCAAWDSTKQLVGIIRHIDHRSICLSVCVCVWKMYCGKTADWIWMPFGVVTGVGQGMGVLDGLVIVEGKEQFWGKFGASHCNQWAFATRSSQITLRTCFLFFLS